MRSGPSKRFFGIRLCSTTAAESTIAPKVRIRKFSCTVREGNKNAMVQVRPNDWFQLRPPQVATASYKKGTGADTGRSALL